MHEQLLCLRTVSSFVHETSPEWLPVWIPDHRVCTQSEQHKWADDCHCVLKVSKAGGHLVPTLVHEGLQRH